MALVAVVVLVVELAFRPRQPASQDGHLEVGRSFGRGRALARVLGLGFQGLAMPCGAAALVVAAPLPPGGKAAASPLPSPLVGAALASARLVPPCGGVAARGAAAGAVAQATRQTIAVGGCRRLPQGHPSVRCNPGCGKMA